MSRPRNVGAVFQCFSESERVQGRHCRRKVRAMGSSRIDDILPSHSGDESPCFEDLLADGSFQARLAKARQERARTLAKAGIADESDLLLQRRNPWDRLPPANDPEAHEPRQTTEKPRPQESEPLILPLRLEEPKASRPMAQAPKRPIVPPPVAAVEPATRLPKTAARPERRIGRFAVAGGFFAGLAIGAVLAFTAPTSIQSWIALRVALLGSSGPVGAVPPVPPVAVPSDDATIAAEGASPRPAIGGGLALLAAQTLSHSQPRLRLDRIDPIVLEEPPQHYVVWDAPGVDLSLGNQAEPTPAVSEWNR